MKKKLLIALAACVLPVGVITHVGATGSHHNNDNDCKQSYGKYDQEVKNCGPSHDCEDRSHQKDQDKKQPKCEKPVDVCKNIEGYQKEVPEGKVLGQDGTCVDKPVEVPTPEPTPTPVPVPAPAPVQPAVETQTVVSVPEAVVAPEMVQGK